MNTAKSPFEGWVIKLAILSTICFMSIGVMTPVLDELIRQPFEVGNSGTATFMAIHGVASILFGLIAGLWSDWAGRRVPLIIMGFIGNGITSALIPHIPHFPSLLVLRFFDGAFGAFSFGLILTYVLDRAGAEHRSRTMGAISISIAAGFLIAPIMTGLLAGHLKWLFGISGAMLAAGGFWMVPDLRQPERIERLGGGMREALRAVYAEPRLLVPTFFSFVDKFTFGTLAHLTSLAVADLFNLGTRATSGVLFGFWISFSLLCVPAGKLIDRFGTLRMIVVGSTLYGISLVAMGLTNFAGFAIAMMLGGAFCAVRYVPSVTLVGEIAGPTTRGISMGIWNMAGSIGIVMGLVLSGKLSQQSYALAYGVAGGLELCCALVGLILTLTVGARFSRPAAQASTSLTAEPAASREEASV